MQSEEDKVLFANLKFVPQVSLLAMPKTSFQFFAKQLLKKIICFKQFCTAEDFCRLCQKLDEGSYFDLQWYAFSPNNLMKKNDVARIITTLSQQSIEYSNPKICVLEGIEFTSVEAANTFLKFLEELPENTFLIFGTTNIEKVLPTIKSRSQIFTLDEQETDWKDRNFNNSDFLIVSDIIGKFIQYDNMQKFNENFFLIREITETKEKVFLFFQFLLLLAEKKLLKFRNEKLHSTIKAVLVKWENSNQFFLINMIECLTKIINKFSNTKNINLNLLLNYFFITIYQGQEDE